MGDEQVGDVAGRDFPESKADCYERYCDYAWG